jgi:hypothetical protein
VGHRPGNRLETDSPLGSDLTVLIDALTGKITNGWPIDNDVETSADGVTAGPVVIDT